MNHVSLKQYKVHWIIPIVTFICFFLVGIRVYKDFGLPWDNHISRTNGVYAYKYLWGDRAMDTYKDKLYSTGLELPLVILENSIKPSSTQEVFYFRYISLFVLFILSLIAFYYYIVISTKQWWLGLIGVLFVFLYPRIFVDAFTNTKDIGFLSFVILSMTTFLVFTRRNTIVLAILHGFVLGLTIAIRPFGIVFAPLFVLYCISLLVYKKHHWKHVLLNLVFYSTSFIVGVLLFWPYLWPDPVGRFISALKLFTTFPFPGRVLYFGTYYLATDIPWHYTLGWLSVTVPSIILMGTLIGLIVCISIVINTLRRKKKYKDILISILICLYWVFIPLGVIIFTSSTLYDGWRHMYAIYPGIVLIALLGIQWLWERQWKRVFVRSVVVILLLVQIVSLMYWMVKTHPHQHVYFNVLSGGMKNAKENFDLDYWALSYRKCLEYILANDKREKIFVYFHTSQIDVSYILSPEDQQRIVEVKNPLEANYFMSNYREHKEEYPVNTPPFYTVDIDGVRIAVVYRIKS